MVLASATIGVAACSDSSAGPLDSGQNDLTVGQVIANIVNAACERYIACGLSYGSSKPYASMSACVSMYGAMVTMNGLSSTAPSCVTSVTIQQCDQATADTPCASIMQSGLDPAACSYAALFVCGDGGADGSSGAD
jgi:hypothetical protein